MTIKYKDSADKIRYFIDWSEWLGTDTLTSVVWTIPSGITSDTETNTTTKSYIRLIGGTVGYEYIIKAHAVSSGNEEKDKSFKLIIRED